MFTINGKPVEFPSSHLRYSDDAETLLSLLPQLSISVSACGVIASPWNKGMQAAHCMVTVSRGQYEPFTFDYYGSHYDALALQGLSHTGGPLWPTEIGKAKATFHKQLPYSILCAIACDYTILDEEPEDLGMNSDSIKDMAKWNDMRAHCKALRSALRLTDAELASLPR